jgi:hypothetical protein
MAALISGIIVGSMMLIGLVTLLWAVGEAAEG